MDLATVLLLHKSSFIVGAICFFYVRWRSGATPGLGVLAVGFSLLAIASTLAGLDERLHMSNNARTLWSFSLGANGYGLMAVGLFGLSRRHSSLRDWWPMLLPVTLTLSAAITPWYVDNGLRASVFNGNAALLLALSGLVIARDFFQERLTARFGLSVAIFVATSLSALVVVGFIFPNDAPLPPRYAFFLLIICHFAVALFVLVLVQERAEEKLTRLANTDMLTGVPNRQHFFSSLPKSLGPGDAFVLIDIDFFKSVNDRFGHDKGDIVLVSVARTIADSIPRSSVFGRLGGEEFSLFLRGETEASAFALAEQIREAVNALSLVFDGKQVSPTVSAGVALWEAGLTELDVQKRADQALYSAKNNGRNRVELFTGMELVNSTPALELRSARAG
ncbi:MULTISPECIES: GGDEF domain-containing protein [Rhizobium]|uniref:GGDEF domain-containing protein n=1 Tax=Rhizobium TaxID=379 RepID=UPI00103DA4A3|nr:MULTISPECIES: GGDEF domain-containing protein [Rhizobium]MBY4588743.1 GGDEF domain-containing protein [Rhizobium redzepovicii]MBY4617041.1 GGDEF domain-containing protein [Rhizobium redzepovicii]TBY48306.1 GGDEF domain-containing protein [Rhizobium leguminosarum bv. viciae]ULJ79887.1 GGDEF domain-containing protein [Rhizobium sp. C104]